MSYPSETIGKHTAKPKTWSPAKDAVGEVISYIDLSSIDKDKKSLDYELIQAIPASDAPSRAKQLVEVDDILVATVRPNLNGVAIIDRDLKNATASTGYCVLRTNETLETKYLYYWVRSKAFIEDMMKKAIGANYPTVSDKIIKQSKIPLPPLEQQKKIAAILDAADAYRKKTKAVIAKYDELTQSLFLDMFGDPVTNPKGWENVIFTDVLVLRRGFDLPVQDRTHGDYPIMASNGILDWHNEFRVNGPGVVTGRSGTLGQVHYVESDYWPLNTALYSQDLKGNNPIYVLYLLKNFRVERFSRGAGVPTLNRNLVHAENIMSVPLDLQNQFAERVQAIEAQKEQAQACLVQAEDLFNSLLQKAFKGELV